MRQATALRFLMLAVLLCMGLRSDAQVVFDGVEDPTTGAVQGPDGNLYVAASNRIYRITTKDLVHSLYEFASGYPQTLLVGPDGKLYGTSSEGGTEGNGFVFSLSLSGQMKVLFSFPQSQCSSIHPTMPWLTLGADGYLYGPYQNSIMRISSTGQSSVVHTFLNGSEPDLCPSAVVQASDGNFYGVYNEPSGDNAFQNYFYSMTPSGQTTTIYTPPQDFGLTESPLVEASPGNLFGFGGTGTAYAFSITFGGDFSEVLPDTNFAFLSAPLLATDGMFYGSAPDDYTGGVFQLNPSSGKVSEVLAFSSSQADYYPYGYTYSYDPTIQGSDGLLYVSTNGGVATNGAFYDGYLIAVTPPDGPLAPPVQISLSSSAVTPFTPVTATFNVPNAISVTSQQCYGFSSSNGGPPTPIGKLAGTFDGTTNSYSGTVTFSPAPGNYKLALTCGGIESGLATLFVGYPTATTLTASPTTVTPPGTVTLTATVKRSASGATGTPTGSVTFSSGSVTLGTASLNGSGVATFAASSSGIAAGQYPVTARYNGDSDDAASTSASVTVTVE